MTFFTLRSDESKAGPATYSDFFINKMTASGDIYTHAGFTAALLPRERWHAVPLGTKLKLTYQGRTVIVKVNDRGAGDGSMERVLDLTEGSARWVAWEEGTIDARSSHLALFEKHNNGNIQSVWSTAWPDAWSPSLLMLQEWRWHDRPLLAITLQFGAAAEQIDIYGLNENNRPQRLVEKTAANVSWKVTTAGQRLLVLYEAKPTVLKATCYGWQENKLVVQSCDKE